jgi:tripartite-type tricarboxylate transporter receptor subunit TctC
MRRALFLLMVVFLCGLGLSLTAVDPTLAADYPQKSITLVIPHPPGGSTDIVGRDLAENLRGQLGQPVVIVNKNSPQVGLTEVVQARPDGYTLGYVHSNYLTLTPLQTDLPFKGPQDMSIIATAHTTHLMLAVSPDSPWKTTTDLLEASKAAPGKIRVAGSALGSIDNVNYLELSELGKAQLTYVPFSGGGPSLAGFLGGHVEALTVTPIAIKPHVDAGKARILGVFSPKRIEMMPDVPTMKEQGFDVSYAFVGVLFGPKGLPDKVKSTLAQAVKKVLEDPNYANAQRTKGFEIAYVSSNDLAKQLITEHEKMKVLVEKFNLKQQ